MKSSSTTVDRSSLSTRRFGAIPKLAVSMAMLLIGAPIAACSASSGPGPNPYSNDAGDTPDECQSDDDCAGTQICKAGSCVASSKHDAGADSSTNPEPDASPTMTCAPTSSSCTENKDCCNFQKGTGYCTDFGSGGECADSCATNSDCSSGCCVATQGGGSVCGPSTACTTPICHTPGQSCSATLDCCQTGSTVGPYGATCMSDDYECHAKCYASNECGSGCCVKLTGVSYGACGTSTGHTCL